MNRYKSRKLSAVTRIIGLAVIVLHIALMITGCAGHDDSGEFLPECELADTGELQLQTDEKQPVMPPVGNLREEQSFGDYTVRTYRDMNTGGGSFEILRNGRQIYSQEGWKFYIGRDAGEDVEEDSIIPMGEDLTGNGKANLIISEWTGGAHSSFISSLFEIDDAFRKIVIVDGVNTGVSFADLDEDGIYEITMRDWTFGYWRTSYVGSPAPRVILRWKDGAYKLATNLMRTSPPSVTELEEEVRTITDGEKWLHPDIDNNNKPTSELWAYMLDLIYGGNAEYAWKFLDNAWPAAIPGKVEFLKAFRKQLACSPYWPEIKAMNES